MNPDSNAEVPLRGAANSNWHVRIFFDGACPLCRREMGYLMKRDTNGAIDFVDTAAAGFDATAAGIPTDPERLIHGMLPDGTIIRGLEVFRRAYRAIGLGWLLAPTGWPLLRRVFDRGYAIFARHRIAISRLFGKRSCDTNQCGL